MFSFFRFNIYFIADWRERISQGQIKPAGVWCDRNSTRSLNTFSTAELGKSILETLRVVQQLDLDGLAGVS